MALAAGISPARRGQPVTAGQFGYPVAPGEKIWRGGLVGLNSSGQLQRLQTAGTVVFAGLAERDYDNSASAAASSDKVVALKGVFGLTVSGASFSNINQNVYATDDATLSLAGALAGVFARGGGDTGNGTIPGSGGGALSIGAGAKVGVYTGTILSGATTFSLQDPNGDAMPNGTLGSAYSDAALSFTLSNGGVNFIAGDTFTITISATPAGGMLVGTLAGIENGQTFVKLLGG